MCILLACVIALLPFLGEREKTRKFLNFEQKQLRMDMAQDMLTTFNDDPDLIKKVVITGDES